MRGFVGVVVLTCAIGVSAFAQTGKKDEPATADRSFIVQAEDGYGLSDCLRGSKDGCGQVVADAYCESQGFARAVRFGDVDPADVTGSVPRAPSKAQPALLIITCRE